MTLIDVAGLVLAVAGGIALIFRIFRAGAQFLLDVAHRTTAVTLADLSARRGDLTGVEEKRAAARAARLAARRSGIVLMAWIAVTVAAILSPFTAHLFAAAALLWLVPRRPIRTSPDLPAGVGTPPA